MSQRRRQVPDELRALGRAPAVPDARDGGAHHVHHALPGHALRLGLLRLAAQQPHQRARRCMVLVCLCGSVEHVPASARAMRQRKIAAPRDRLHLARVAGARELQRHVHHREAGAQEHDGRILLQSVERIVGPGIGHEEWRVVEPRIPGRRRTRRQIAGRQHDDVGGDLASIGEEDAARGEFEQADRLARTTFSPRARSGDAALLMRSSR